MTEDAQVSPNYVMNNTPLEEVMEMKDRCPLWFTFSIWRTHFWK